LDILGDEIMPTQQTHSRNGAGSLNKASWLEALDLLEREFLAFRQGGGGVHRPSSKASGTLTLIDADVKRALQLLLNLGG